MAKFLRGDIVLVPFPFSVEDAFKERPALVLAAVPFIGGIDYLLCIISTQDVADRYVIDLATADLEQGMLTQKCSIRPAYTYTVAERRIIRLLARLKPEKTSAVVQTLTEILTV